MKKILFTIVAAFLSCAVASAMDLKEAFAALSNLPNISIKTSGNDIINIDGFSNTKITAAYNLDRQQIQNSGNAAYTILNQIPLVYMINGGNNNNVATFIYATPNEQNSQDILIAVMSGYRGDIVFLYGSVDNAAKEVLQNAPLTMQGDNLSITTTMPDGSNFNIEINRPVD